MLVLGIRFESLRSRQVDETQLSDRDNRRSSLASFGMLDDDSKDGMTTTAKLKREKKIEYISYIVYFFFYLLYSFSCSPSFSEPRLFSLAAARRPRREPRVPTGLRRRRRLRRPRVHEDLFEWDPEEKRRLSHKKNTSNFFLQYNQIRNLLVVDFQIGDANEKFRRQIRRIFNV